MGLNDCEGPPSHPALRCLDPTVSSREAPTPPHTPAMDPEAPLDLSFLSEEEQSAILQVLLRDSELRSLEEGRISKLRHSVLDPSELKILTGDWFSDMRSTRHQDQKYGPDIVRASIRRKKTPKASIESAEQQFVLGSAPIESAEQQFVMGSAPIESAEQQFVMGSAPIENAEQQFVLGSAPIESAEQQFVMGSAPIESAEQQFVLGSAPIESAEQQFVLGSAPIESAEQQFVLGSAPIESAEQQFVLGSAPIESAEQQFVLGSAPIESAEQQFVLGSAPIETPIESSEQQFVLGSAPIESAEQQFVMGSSPIESAEQQFVMGSSPIESAEQQFVMGSSPIESAEQQFVMGSSPIESAEQQFVMGSSPIESAEQQFVMGSSPIESAEQQFVLGSAPIENAEQQFVLGSAPIENAEQQFVLGSAPIESAEQQFVMGSAPTAGFQCSSLSAVIGGTHLPRGTALGTAAVALPSVRGPWSLDTVDKHSPVETEEREEAAQLSGSMMSLFSSGEFGALEVKGSVLFALHYDDHKGEFQIKVYRCQDLAEAKKQRSDPYVKSYLLPDKSSHSKRKTSVRKKCINPVFDETLKYKITMADLRSRTLNLSVWHHDPLGRNFFLGEVEVAMETWDWSDCQPAWHDLLPRTPMSPECISSRGRISLALQFIPAGSQGSGTPLTGELHFWLKEAQNIIPTKGSTIDTFLKSGTPLTGELHFWLKEAQNIIPTKGSTIDTFLKSYVLPDDSKSSRQKTRVVKKSLSPTFNHTMVYDGFQREDLKEACAEFTLWEHQTFSSLLLGGVRLSLGTASIGMLLSGTLYIHLDFTILRTELGMFVTLN
ncbi:UNVERIFIED_CONTAM: hypothetical protein FKN15_027449 [Acipenser sinensis]